MLSQAILDPGDEVVCGWPSFPSYVIYAAKQGAVVHRVPLTDLRYDLEALLAAITPRTKLVYICHPNNPTGTMNTIDELDAYFEQRARPRADRRRPGVLRVHRPARLSRRRRAVPEGRPARRVLRTFSKIYGLAGLRVGYAVASPDGVHGDGEGPPPVRPDDARAGRRAASMGDDAELARRRAVNKEGMARVEAILAAHGFDPAPSVGNFVFAETGTDAVALFDRLLREGVDRQAARGLRRPDRDQGDGRHRRRARVLLGRARPGAATRLTAI